MLKVQILERCPYCKGVSVVFVEKAIDHNGKTYDRYRSCAMCHGSGMYPKWVSLEEFRKLLQQAQYAHEHTSIRDGMHFNPGDVLDDIEEVCDDCGAEFDT